MLGSTMLTLCVTVALIVSAESKHSGGSGLRDQRLEKTSGKGGLQPEPEGIGAQINGFVREALRDDGVIDPMNVVDDYLPDPFFIRDFNISENGSLTTIQGQFKNLSLHGLKGLDIKSMKFNLGRMHLDVVMEIPVLRLEGHYSLNGKLTFLPINGKGDFWMNITGLQLFATTSLNRTSEGDLQVSAIVLDLETTNIELHFDNLMGGGRWSSISNRLLNQMSHLIFDQVKFSMMSEIETNIRDLINSQLALVPQNVIDDKSASVFDDILDLAKQELHDKGLEPALLPNLTEQFARNMLFFIFHGEVKVYNGLLHGLSTLVRTGDVVATYENDSVTFEARFGFENLTGTYDWSASLLGAGPAGSAALHVAEISGYIKLRQPLAKNSHPILESFRVEDIKHLWVDLTGLGTWDFVLEIIINLVSNAFKMSLASTIEGPVLQAVQHQLDNYSTNQLINFD